MSYQNSIVGIVSELDAENMKAIVKFVPEDIPSNWLQILTTPGFYWMPKVNDQVACFVDEEYNQGIVVGLMLKDGEAVYTDADVFGYKLEGVSVQINRNSGEVIIQSDGDVSLKAGKVSIEADKLELKGDLDVTGKIDATGAITSTTEVQAKLIKLSTHTHTSAAPGSPTSPPLPT